MKFHFFDMRVPRIHKGRRQLIQRDEEGKSQRQKCFALFRQGKNSRDVAEMLGMKLSTARRYYSQWNGCPPALEAIYRGLKRELKTKGELSPKIIGMLGFALGLPEWRIIEILHQSHGLKSLLMGKLVQMRRKQQYSTQEQRLEAALHLVVLWETAEVPLEW